MWPFRHLSVTATLCLSAGFLVVAPSTVASASGGVPGDLTGDGTVDTYVLTASPDLSTCTLTVTPGDVTGPYAGHTYQLNVALPTYDIGCPDLSASGDTAGDGKTRVALSWFFCATDQLDLLAAENGSFVIHTYPTIDCASVVGTTDFNGDGRADFWMGSDNPGGLWTWLGQPDGTIKPDVTSSSTEYSSLYAKDFLTPGLQTMYSSVDNRTEFLMSTIFVGDPLPATDLIVYAYGAPLSYLASSIGDPALYDGPWDAAKPTDANHDGWPDVNVAVGSSTFTAFQRPDHSFYLGVRTTVAGIGRGQHPIVTARVAQTSATKFQPTGTVTFIIDGISGAPVTVSGSNAHAKLPAMSPGSHTVMASYSGDAWHPATSSPPVLFTVPTG